MFTHWQTPSSTEHCSEQTKTGGWRTAAAAAGGAGAGKGTSPEFKRFCEMKYIVK